MADYREVLFAKAFRVVPCKDYNEVSYEVREKTEGIFLIFETPER